MKVARVEFHGCPVLELGSDDRWKLHRPFLVKVFHDDNSSRWICVPDGFATDLASVPRLPGVFWLFGDRARRAAIVHDWLYSLGGDREYADDVFLAAMKHEVDDSLSRRMMWAGVRLFGGLFFRRQA